MTMELYYSKEQYKQYLVDKCKKILVTLGLINLTWVTFVALCLYCFDYTFNGFLITVDLLVFNGSVASILIGYTEYKRLSSVFFGTLTTTEYKEIHCDMNKDFYVRLLILNLGKLLIFYLALSLVLALIFSL